MSIKIFLRLISKSLLPEFYSTSFIFLNLTFKYLIYFEFIFVYHAKE